MKCSTDVAIIGGGMIGCSIAYFLQKRGRDVTVFDKGDIGAQASSAAAGLLAPIRPLSKRDIFKSFQLAGMTRLASLIPELEAYSGIQIEYEQTGTLRVLPADSLAQAYEWAGTWKHMGIRIDVLTSEEVYQQEPLLAPGILGAISIADEAQVNPTTLVQAYAQAAVKAGAVLRSRTEIIGIQRSDTDRKVTGIFTERGDLFSCNHIILAAGAWSAQCGKWFNLSLPIYPVRGEIIALKQPTPPIRHMIFDEGIYDKDLYIAPKPNGTVLVGATKAEVGFDTAVSAKGVLHLLHVATQLVPALGNSSLHHMWAGLRPKSRTSVPLLGTAPSWENVTIASGHGGFGVTLSAITGESIAELIIRGQVPELLHPFAPKEGCQDLNP
jgi:glycine oxidase